MRPFDTVAGTLRVPASAGGACGLLLGLRKNRAQSAGVIVNDTNMLMSTQNADSASDPNYRYRGPGLNAWNMRSRRWLDEGRVWHCPPGAFTATVSLRPLHRIDLPGYVAAELPPVNHTGGNSKYLVEYRKREGWDHGIPRSCVSVRRFEGEIGNFGGLAGKPL